MVIDAHMHLGEDRIFGTNDDEEDILLYMDRHKIDGAMLQPGMLTADQRQAHQRIAEMAKAHPGRFWGIAAFSPDTTEEEYMCNAEWAVRTLGFKALKLHTYAFCCSPMDERAGKVFRAARCLGVPVMIHTGAGAPNALPALCIPPARQFADVTIVMAHAGGGYFGSEALVAAMECPNIVLETSWVTVGDIRAFLGAVGCRRVMLGTDLPSNAGVELAKYAALNLPEDQLEWCLGKTAQTVFGL